MRAELLAEEPTESAEPVPAEVAPPTALPAAQTQPEPARPVFTTPQYRDFVRRPKKHDTRQLSMF